MKVKAWYEKVVIPTYETGDKEKNPMFLENRVYQGSSGVVYPHPVIEKIHDERKDKEWNAVFLENEYLKIMILPELGGRIQMAYDKMKGRHFVYYNSVIKPALVGLTGPWISGGIEFNWPQHHRPSTYEPVEHKIENNDDGSVTVWCNELERMFRTKGMAGFTLYPDKAYLEIKVKLYNRTDLPQTFLWWANPAVKVNDYYQSVFPPDVHAVFDHGKRDVSEFPIAKGIYYKVDYSPGTDISRYKNIPVPTSYMAINSDYDFIGGYENETQAGILHVANHHVSPGKKQWTWGNSDFGQAWDRNLTDEDGPYIEIMCGVYTDNQPDFSWLMPGEEKAFNQYFMPYRDVGVVKNAGKDAVLNVETEGNLLHLKAFATAVYPGAKIIIQKGKSNVFEDTHDFHPAGSYQGTIEMSADLLQEELSVKIISAKGKVLVQWKPEADTEKEIPEPAKAAKDPKEISNNEQLYLTGLHLEQYRHATYDPRDYYSEALKRDPSDVRNNNAMGLWYLRRGRFEKAEFHFRKAIDTLTERNPNPIDGEPFYNLGLSLIHQDKHDEAYNTFYKATWNAAWQDTGYFQLARIDAITGKWGDALDHAERSLLRNLNNHKVRQLKVSILRKMGRKEEAKVFCEDSLRVDKFNMSLYYEQYLITGEKKALDQMKTLMAGNIHNYIEYAQDYACSGFFGNAVELLDIGITEQQGKDIYPLALYFKALYEEKSGDKNSSLNTLQRASEANPDYCFPNQTEVVSLLQWALRKDPDDAKAAYYLGNFWYNAKNYDEAVKCWEQSVVADGNFPTAHRNLALAYFNKRNEPEKALKSLEKAFELDNSDARILMELDQLYKKLNYTIQFRLDFLEKHYPQVEARDDLYLELASLYNYSGSYEKAYSMLMKRKFHPWEGGEGKVTTQYIWSLTELAKEAFQQKEYDNAIDLLQKARVYPDNLGEGKLYGAQENELLFWLGLVHEAENDRSQADQYFGEGSQGLSQPSAAMFYNDQQPDTIFYQGLSLLKAGKESEAGSRFQKLIDYGKEHINDRVKIDYFAVSLPDLLIWEENLDERNKQLCLYLIGLGELGKGNRIKAKEMFRDVLEKNAYHMGALRVLNSMDLIGFIIQ